MHIDWTVHVYDVIIVAGVVIAALFKDKTRINSVPGLNARLQALDEKLDALSLSVAKLQGAFDVYKELKYGR